MVSKVKVPCTLDSLREVRGFAQQVLASEVLPGKDKTMMLIALDEICANIIIHSNYQNPDKWLEVSIDVRADSIIVEALDEGVFFNEGGYQERSMDEIFSRRQAGGMGLMIVRRAVDDFTYQRDHNVNIFTLVKKLNPENQFAGASTSQGYC